MGGCVGRAGPHGLRVGPARLIARARWPHTPPATPSARCLPLFQELNALFGESPPAGLPGNDAGLPGNDAGLLVTAPAPPANLHAPPARLTHVDSRGRAAMVDVGAKPPTRRTAVASARVLLGRAAFDAVAAGTAAKGDVLAVARIAGILGAKAVPSIIPLCHPVALDRVGVELRLVEEDSAVDVTATAACTGRTGVEMEALAAAASAALCVYDMTKARGRGPFAPHPPAGWVGGGRVDSFEGGQGGCAGPSPPLPRPLPLPFPPVSGPV